MTCMRWIHLRCIKYIYIYIYGSSGLSVTVSTSSLSVTLSTNLPSYSDFPEPSFVQRKLRSSLHGDGDCALHSILDSYNNLEAPCLREQHGGHHFWMNVWERSTSSLSHSAATLLMSKIGGEVSIDVASALARYLLIYFLWEQISIYV